MIRCRACGTDNETYMEFCKKCASELPREGRTGERAGAQASVIPMQMAMDAQPYDYRLPYRPGRGFPQGYERPKGDGRGQMSKNDFQPRPVREQPLPVRVSAQLPPIPEPQGRVMEAPIVRIPDTYIPPPQPPAPIQPMQNAGQNVAQSVGRGPVQNVGHGVGHGVLQSAPQNATHNIGQNAGNSSVQNAGQGIAQNAGNSSLQNAGHGTAQNAGNNILQNAVQNGVQNPVPIGSQNASNSGSFVSGDERADLENALFAPQSQKSKPEKSSKKPKGRKRDYDYDDEDEFDDDEPVRRSTALTVMLMASLAILLFAGVWFAGSYINSEYGNIGAFVQSVFGGSTPAPSVAPVSPAEKIRIDVQPGTHEGKPVHEIIFYGENGQTIELPSIGIPNYSRTYDITANYAPLKIEDSLFIPAEPDETTPAEITVKLAANLIDVDKQVYPLDVPEFVVAVPQATFTLTSPSETVVMLDEPVLALSGQVSQGARLYIDGSDASSALDALGKFSYNYEIPQYGERTITVEAKAPYQRPQSTTLSVNYPKREVSITVDGAIPSQDDPFKAALDGTQDESVEVKGTFEANAALSIEGTLDGEPVIDASAGTFSFTAKLESYGRNAFNIVAEKDGGKSTFELTVEKKPNPDEYTPKARRMDYASLSKNADDQKERIYLCEGKVSSIIQTSPYALFILNVGTSDKPQNILMEYYGTTPLDDSKTYRIYGDVSGLDAEQNLPKLIARFIYEQ